MPVSRRGLFGLLAVAPVAAVKAAQAVQHAPVDPPLIAVGAPVEGPYFLGAGSITWVDPDYDERVGEVLRPIPIQFANTGQPA